MVFDRVCIYMVIFFSLEKYLSDEEDQRVCEEEQVDDVINHSQKW